MGKNHILFLNTCAIQVNKNPCPIKIGDLWVSATNNQTNVLINE